MKIARVVVSILAVVVFIAITVIGLILFLAFVTPDFSQVAEATEVPTPTCVKLEEATTPQHTLRRPVGGLIRTQPSLPTQCTELGADYWGNYILHMPGTNVAERKWLLRVSACESGRENCEYNRSSGASGIMQYLPSTFRSAGGHNIWDGHEQIRLALAAYRAGHKSAWVCQ